MIQNLFSSVFSNNLLASINFLDFLICIGFSLGLGVIIALCYMYKSKYTQSFLLTLALLPSVVCVVIMLVNGNIGAGVAVAGAFSLVRFRSTTGTAREICTLFFSMGAGLICGLGYLGFSLVFTVIICAAFMIFNKLNLSFNSKNNSKVLKITIPEDLDYTGVFDDIFDTYLAEHELTNVKTCNLGSMFKLTYDIKIKDLTKEKELIDKLRIKNGNLEISILKAVSAANEL